MGQTSQNPTQQQPTNTQTQAAAPRGFSLQDIQGVYTDQNKMYDVPRALRGVSPDSNGLYSLDQLQGLNTGWMSQRSAGDWNNALLALSQMVGGGGGGGGAGAFDPLNPGAYSMTMPWAGLAASDPGFGMMAKNAGYGDSVTPMPQMNPVGWTGAQGGGQSFTPWSQVLATIHSLLGGGR